MMDYYGSIVKTHEEIHLDLSQRELKDNYCKTLLDEVLGDKEYSVSGYMVFFRKEIINNYHSIYQERSLLLNDKKLKSYFGLSIHLADDIISHIFQYINLNNNVNDK